MKRVKAKFVYLFNPSYYNVKKPTVFIVRPLSGAFLGSDVSYDPKKHIIVNVEDFERLSQENDYSKPFLLV